MGDGDKERLLAILVAAAAVAATLAWLALQLASIASHRHLVDANLGDALAVATRVIVHPTKPIPATVDEAPGVVAFYLAALALLLGGGLLASAAPRLWSSSPGEFWGRACSALLDRQRGRRRDERAARWASRHDLHPLHIHAPTPGRLTLGTVDGRLVATEKLHSLLVVGPSGSMKTTGLAIPALLEWNGPVVATSVKTDLLDATVAHRRELGKVHVYDPAGITGSPGARWSPLAGCENWSVAMQRASTICRLADEGARPELAFFYLMASKLLATLLFAAARTDRDLADVVRWVDTQERDEVQAAIDESGLELARNAWQGTLKREPKTNSSIYTTVETALLGYADPALLETTRHPNLNIAEFLDGGAHTLYLVAPVDRQDQLRTAFVTLIDAIRAAAYATGATRPVDPPLLLLFDELANIAAIPALDKLASTASAQGIHIVSIVQDLAQLHARYGKAAETIINNHKGKLILPGSADTTTLDWTSRITGDQELRQTSTTARTGIRDSTTESTTWRPLAPPHLVRQLQPGHGLLVYGHLPTAVVQLRHAGAHRRSILTPAVP